MKVIKFKINCASRFLRARTISALLFNRNKVIYYSFLEQNVAFYLHDFPILINSPTLI